MAGLLGLLAIAAVAADRIDLLALTPAAVIGAAICARFPVAALVSVFGMSAFASTFLAYANLPPGGTADVILIGLWLGLIYSLTRPGATTEIWMWPGLAAPGIYLVATLASLLGSDNASAAFDSFRIAGWHMAALLMVALFPWPDGSLRRLVRSVVVIAALVGSYAILRKISGPAAAEQAVTGGARFSTGTLFTGSFFTPQDLAGWCGMLVPFCVSLSLIWRGRWRLVAALAAATCAFAMLAADRRAAVVGAALGTALVIVLILAARRPFGGRRLALAFAAVVTTIGAGAALYAGTVAQSERTSDRFTALISNRENDYTYQLRLSRWDAAEDVASDRFLGYGLGTVGEIGESRTDEFAIAPFLDSSYLKIALEQGYIVMGLFIATFLALVASLGLRAIRATNAESAAVAIGACGTAVVMALLFYSSFFIERLTVLSGWLILGVAAAHFVRRQRDDDPRPAR